MKLRNRKTPKGTVAFFIDYTENGQRRRKVLKDIHGGRLHPEQPFAACGRNITLLPIRHRLQIVSNTLKVFCGDPESNKEVDRDLLALLGKRTEAKRWLAASLDKTIRLQLSPPAELRAISALAGPVWIKQQSSG